MQHNDSRLSELSYALSAALSIHLYKVQQSAKEFIHTSQLIRSASSVTANIAESEGASSLRDFIAKLSIARKEAYESQTWLKLIRDLELISNSEFIEYTNTLVQIIKLLQASIKTATKKLNIDN